jgi:hypothetical protein
MLKMVILIIITLLTFSFQNSWAELSAQQKEMMEKQKKMFEERQAKMQQNMPVRRGAVGRYHAVRMDGAKVFIIDTADGKFWLWNADNNSINYQNQVPADKK